MVPTSQKRHQYQDLNFQTHTETIIHVPYTIIWVSCRHITDTQ